MAGIEHGYRQVSAAPTPGSAVPAAVAAKGNVIEQAVYTSAQTRSGDGYQIVASSPNVSSEEARSISTWCPSHDGLLSASGTSASVNFHPLPGGNHCVSRTQSAGAEYSGRQGRRIHTHCLIVSRDVLARFCNDPFAVTRAAVAVGAIQPNDPLPSRLEQLHLTGRASVCDRVLITRLGQQFGAESFGSLLHLALTKPALGVASRRAERVLAGLLACLPVECRLEVPLTTGLRFSTRRPFRWLAIDSDRSEWKRLEQQFGVTVVDVDSPRPETPHRGLHPWALFVTRCLRHHRLSVLENELTRSRETIRLTDLAELGEQCQQNLSGSRSRSAPPARPA